MNHKGWWLFTAMSIFWGISYFLIRIAVRELEPSFVVFARVGIATLILVPIAFQRHQLPSRRKQWGAIVLLSCIQITGPFLLISYGELHIASSLTSLLVAAEPLLVALFALRLDPSERARGWRLLGLIMGMVGVITLLGFDGGGDGQKWLGVGMVLLATSGYAVGALLLGRPTIAKLPRLGVIAVECATATALLFPLALTQVPSHLPSLKVMASLLVLGLICTALAYLAFFALIAEVGASRGTVFTYANPAVAVLLGVAVLGEPLSAATLGGFVLILLGSWLATHGRFLLLSRRLPQLRL